MLKWFRETRREATKGGVTVHITGPGIAHVDPDELLHSEAMGRLIDDIQASRERRAAKGKERKQ